MRASIVLLVLPSCSFLIPLLQGERCDPRVFAIHCEQGELLVCQDDVVFHLDCGDEVCNTTRNACGTCGDGVLNEDNLEECDDGNTNNEDACLNCQNARCGDFVHRKDITNPKDVGFEACDDGKQVEGDGCDSNCTLSACGNGIAAVGELCFAEANVIDAGAILRAAALGDLDGDQHLDLIAARFDQDSPTQSELRVFHNNAGALNITDSIPLDHPPSAIAIADFNQEDGPDIAVALEEAGSLQLFFNNGFGQSTSSQIISDVGTGVASLFVDDLEGDTFPDLVGARLNCDNPLQCQVLFLTNLNFVNTQVQELELGFLKAQADVKSADINGDFLPDIISALPITKEIAFHLSQNPFVARGPAIFLPQDNSPLELLLGDFDKDQDQDLIVRFEDSVRLFTNDSNVGFTLPQTLFSSAAKGLAKIDLDGDQDLDVALTTQDPPAIHLLQNRSGGVFQELTPLELDLERAPSTLLVGDLNNDGRDDLIALDLVSSQMIIFLSQP
jgi:hypothetical protein